MLSLLFSNSFQVDVICGEETTATFISNNILPEDCYPLCRHAGTEAPNSQETKSLFRQLKQWPDFLQLQLP